MEPGFFDFERVIVPAILHEVGKRPHANGRITSSADELRRGRGRLVHRRGRGEHAPAHQMLHTVANVLGGSGQDCRVIAEVESALPA